MSRLSLMLDLTRRAVALKKKKKKKPQPTEGSDLGHRYISEYFADIFTLEWMMKCENRMHLGLFDCVRQSQGKMGGSVAGGGGRGV